MKKMIALVVMLSIGSLAFAQAPLDLSYLTNRGSLASHMLKQVNEIEVSVTVSSAGEPPVYGDCPVGYVCTPVNGPTVSLSLPYSGPPSFTAIARALKGTLITPEVPIPDSYTTVTVSLRGDYMPNNDGKQYLFGGGAGGKAVFDGENWRLPRDASEPPMYMSGIVFIPVPGLTKAWVVETNQWGWAIKKSLSVWDGAGFYFETSMAGEIFLCLETSGKGDASESWVYDLRNDGMRAPLPKIIAAVSIRDSEDVRDYGDDNEYLLHWVYTYKPWESTLTYGKVPLLIANYTQETKVVIWVDSGVGAARNYTIKRIGTGKGGLDEVFDNAEVPEGQNHLIYRFPPGLYHIVPLGIDVCPDWWKIIDVNGDFGSKG